jgi:hypothetical protein
LFYICNEITKPNRAYDLYYRLVDCHTLNINPEFWMARDETCKQKFTNDSNFLPQLWARYPYFNESRPEEGLKYNLINLKSKIFDYDYFTINFQLLKLDQDYFTKSYKKYFFITPENYSKGEDRSNLYTFEFNVNNYSAKVVDNPKIPELLLKISGIMGIIQIILSYLSNYYCKFAFKKFIFNESFDEKDCLEVNQLYSAKYPSLVDAIYKKENGIKNLNNILCFRNFLSKSLGIPFKEESIYNFIENVLNRKISLENIISRSLTMNMEGEKNNLQMNSFYKTSLHMEISFFERIDIFSKSKSILFDKSEKISTVCGKGLTYVYFLICGVLLILTGLLCWNSDNFKITILNKNTIEITDTSDKRINTIFKFSILPNFAQGSKFLLFNNTSSQYQEFQYRNCTDEDLLYFGQSNNSSYINYCVELKDIIDNI